MSFQATQGAWDTFPEVVAWAIAHPGHKVSPLAVGIVHLRLAECHRHDRGWTNETAEQVAAACHLAPAQVRRAFTVLGTMGAWLPVTRGNQHNPTRRVPGPLVATPGGVEHAAELATPGGSDHTEVATPGGSEHEGSNHTEVATPRGAERTEVATQPTTPEPVLGTLPTTPRGATPLTPLVPLSPTRVRESESTAGVATTRSTAPAPPAEPTVGRGGSSAKGNGRGPEPPPRQPAPPAPHPNPSMRANHLGLALTAEDITARAVAQVIRDYDLRHGDAPARRPLMERWRQAAERCTALVDSWRVDGASDTECIAAVAERVSGNTTAIPRSLIGAGNRGGQCPLCSAHLSTLTRCLCADGYVPEDCPFYDPNVPTVERVIVPVRTKADNEARKAPSRDPLF